MSGFLAGLLVLSAKGALVAALVALVLVAGGRRLPPALRHGLWLLVFVRLALPALPASPASLFARAPSEGGLLPALDPRLVAGAVAPAAATAGGAAAGGPAVPWAGAAAAAWLLVVALLLGRRLAATLRLRRRLRRARPVTDERALRLLEVARRALRLESGVALLESDRLEGPAVAGWLRPRIVLPRGLAGSLDDEALRHVLLHELAHVKRLDGPAQAVASLVAAVHWFNPLAWYALHRLEAECETACDAAVLARLPRRRRAGYGHTLIEVAARPRPASVSLGAPVLGLSRHRNLKRRILMIARYRPTSLRRALAGAVLFAALAAVTLTDAPAAAGPQAEATPAPAPAEGRPALDPAEVARARESLDRVREAGSAMFFWVEDAAAGQEWPEAGYRGEDGQERIVWDRCPTIGHAELESLLVPDYIAELPATDAWGHPLEFCLERPPTLQDRYAAGVRSPGRDGAFEGDVYPMGAFPADAFDRDLLWVDGYFMAWPSRDAE